MIKQLFLPDRVGDVFIGSHTYIGVELTKTDVIATKIRVSGRSVVVLDVYQEPVIKTDDQEWGQGVSNALEQLNKKIGLSSGVRLALPNNIVIFKELALPFDDLDKIRQVLPFELEQQIPFAITDVAIDFVVVNTVPKKTNILVGIVQKKDVAYYLELFERAHIELAGITVDLFALYTVWCAHPRYANMITPTLLIDINAQFSTLIYIKNRQLCAMRSVAQGVSSFAKAVAERTQKTSAFVMEQLMRFGVEHVEDPELNKAVVAEFEQFCAPFKLTIQAFSSNVAEFEPISQVIIVIRGLPISGLDRCMHDMLGLDVSFFDTAMLFSGPRLTMRNALTRLTSTQILSLGAVYPFGIASTFDVLSSYETKKSEKLIAQQVFLGIILCFVCFSLLIGVGYWRVSRARAQVVKARQTAIQQLNKEFNLTERTLPAAVLAAQQAIETSETTWEGLSGANRYSFLKYLQELCVKIDREGLGLQVQKLVMTKKSITLAGRVRDYKALKAFIDQLNNSSLFNLAAIPQEPDFKEIKLWIAQPDKEQS